MSKKVELGVLLLTDAVATGLAYLVFYMSRFHWNWLITPSQTPHSLWVPLFSVSAFWLVVFMFAGLYRTRYAESRFDELVYLFKVVFVGILLLFFALFVGLLDAESARRTMLFYWFAVFVFVGIGRFAIRTLEKAMVLRGKGTRKALIVGWTDKVAQLHQDVMRYPAGGLRVVGAVKLSRNGEHSPSENLFAGEESSESAVNEINNENGLADTYAIDNIPELIDQLAVEDVLIALGANDQDELMHVLKVCDGKPVVLKLVPDFYHVIGGMARTEQVYGLPLIEVLPEPMPPWAQNIKRVIDIVVSAIILIIGMPIYLVVGLMVKVTSPGPAIFQQKRVGQHGQEFMMYKFRTMRVDAEAKTGPVWASENDPRYTPMGRWLRKTRLDEVPQFWNVFKGEMSLVGPRPERRFFVEKLAKEIPLYRRRQRVKPGITGFAQVKWKYDASLDDVRQKTKYDFFYIENMSLRMDFKILLSTIRTALMGQGR